MGGHFGGTALFMERLDPLGDGWSDCDTDVLLAEVGRLAQHAFHNDVKLPNVLRRDGRPTLIDFDLMSPWLVKVAVTSSCIEHDFGPLLEPQGPSVASLFREYYDLFAFSLTLHDGALYRRVLHRLIELWGLLESCVLRPLLGSADAEKLNDVPFEVLVRVPLEGVSVNLLDLRGNLYVHNQGDVGSRQAWLLACAHLPQLLRSGGAYWPQVEEQSAES